jgi:hypothetical protein
VNKIIIVPPFIKQLFKYVLIKEVVFYAKRKSLSIFQPRL